MKIDIHVHTRKTKIGDAKTRDIEPKKFCETVTSTDVKIIAITNHNVFDIEQYQEIIKELKGEVQIWPGVELDILEDSKKGHLLVIVSPDRAKDFDSILKELTKESTPDTFVISIDDTLSNFDKLNPLYIAHYHQKKPDITEEDVNKIIGKTANKNRVIREVTNSISAGIFISHGHPSIFGSDIHDWDKYKEISENLPELRLPVTSFDQFCLLLDKDVRTINTILDKKSYEVIEISPFEDDTFLELKCYNDINIFFGPKGTGKTKILGSIARYFNEKGVNAKVFESGPVQLKEQHDLKGEKYAIDLKVYNIDYCTKEINFIKNSNEENITNIKDYVRCFSTEIRNRNAKKFMIKDSIQESVDVYKREFESFENTLQKMNEFKMFLEEDAVLKKVDIDKELEELKAVVDKVVKKLSANREGQFINWKKNELFNNLVNKVKEEITRKTGTPKKPSTTGFKKYASNRISIEANTKKILDNINKGIKDDLKYVGNLGKEKGDMYCRTRVVFQDGDVSGKEYNPIASINKTPQKKFSQNVKEIYRCAYASNLFEKISDLNEIEDVESITSLYELILFSRCFVINNEQYTPSNGESSMLLLHKELNDDKDVYILDEPEKSLGNDYISDVIVPLIKEKAKSGKKIFIATHDANIAVRTLPYNSIYRAGESKTYVGNPFSNSLVNIDDSKDIKDWKAISMKRLEGGKEAFGERGKIYGHS